MLDRLAEYLGRWRLHPAAAPTAGCEIFNVPLTIVGDPARYPAADLEANMRAAMRLIADHAPVWIERMRRLGVRIHLERTPGTRAKLVDGRWMVLDSYFVMNFLPAQVASSIVHETVHARVRVRGIPITRETIAHEERLCRRAELRFGKVLLARGVAGAAEVVDRAAGALTLADEDVAPAVDWQHLNALAEAARRGQT